MLFFVAPEVKVSVSKELRFLREMADAGNFGGSVPECKRNTVLPPLLSGDCLFFL
ncbi:hypothetical protein RO060_002511 [Salmonella enterica]|nr:hypothetical protein [Salmonella enterica]ELH3241386.1 hypothetical protein [Salmonella enterica]